MPIAKVVKGNSPRRCADYVLEKEKANLLESTFMGDGASAITAEFDINQQSHLGNGAKKHTTLNVHHCSIGLPVGVELDQPTLLAIAHTYLEGMGFSRMNNQYFIAQHHDSRHPHIHIVANRIGVDGKTVSDAWERRKAEAIMRQIEVDYGLPINPSSREVAVKAPKVGEVRRARDRGEPIPRVWMQEQIQTIAPQCLTLAQFKEKLATVGITLAVVPLQGKAKGKKRKQDIEGEMAEGAVATIPPEQWGSEAVGLIYRLDTPPWQHDKHARGQEDSPPNEPTTRGITNGAGESETPEQDDFDQATNGKGREVKGRGIKQGDRPVNHPVEGEAATPFAVFSASRLGKRFTQQGLKTQFGVGLPLVQRIEREVEQSVRRLFDPQQWLTSEFGAEFVRALPSALPVKTERPASPTPSAAVPASTAVPPAVQPEVESQERLEARRYYIAQWQELSQSVQASLPDIQPDRLPVAVAAVAINKWDISTAAAILSQSEAGLEQQALSKAAFRAWLREQLETAVNVAPPVRHSQRPSTPAVTDEGR